MSVIIDGRSAKIDVQLQHAKPALYTADTQRVSGHLTEGFDPAKVCQLEQGRAMMAVGSVNVAASPAELKGWQFGFLQIVRINFAGAFYAGTTRKEGSIGIQSHIPPAMAQSIMLDSIDVETPWIRGTFLHVIAPGVVTEEMKDHPTCCAGKTMNNKKTKLPNYLFHLLYEYEFWTTFAAQSPAGTLQHLAHFHWRVRWDYRFVWRAKKLVIAADKSCLRHEPVAMGAPTESAIQSLLTTPVPPYAVLELNAAVWRVKSDSANRKDNDDWFVNVPADFFT